MTLIQPILIACVALGVGVYFWKLRSSSLDRVIVLTIAAFGMLLVAFPTLSIRLANRVGVGRGADLVTYLGLLGLGFFALVLYSRLKGIEERLTELVRLVAIKEARQPEK